MSDFVTIILCIILVIAVFQLRKWYLKEHRFRYFEIQKSFTDNHDFKNVGIFEETIVADFKIYHITVTIKEDNGLKLSLYAYAFKNGKPSINIAWEPIRTAYNSLSYIGLHVVSQTAQILSEESQLEHNHLILSISYSRAIPIQKRKEYDRDLESWFRTTNNYYD